MSLTWKDAVTTLLAAGVIVLAWASWQGWNMPLIGNPRIAALLMIIIGITMCTLSGYETDQALGIYGVTMGIVGGAAVVLGLLAMIIGAAGWTVATAIVIVLMWIVTIAHHVFA